MLLKLYEEKRYCFKACPPEQYCECRNRFNNQIKIKNMTELEQVQEELIDVLKFQIEQLSIMSKIELGDDVIQEIVRLQTKINQLK